MVKEEKNFIASLLFIYGLVFAFFHITPVFLIGFLKSPLTWGDTLDFFTPFAVIPLVYLLYFRINKALLSIKPRGSISGVQRSLAKIFLALGFLLYVDGHGLHLSSNSIARLLQNIKGTELYKATYLFDEIISHSMWDGGVFLISVGLILLAHKLSFKSISGTNIVLLSVGAVFYGFTFTLNGIEGQTVVLTFPAAGVGFLFALLLYFKRKGNQNPLLLFFSIAYFLSVILFAFWGIYHSGFPQFSELGWI